MQTTTPHSLGAGLAAYAERKVARFAGCIEEALATGDAEAIHGLRVASRRLHEPLVVISACTGKDLVRTTRSDLKRLRSAFRDVRDLDVMLHTLTVAPAQGGLTGDDLAELETRLADRRARQLRDAQERCRKRKPNRVVDSVRRILADCARSTDGDEALRRGLHNRLGRLAGRLLDSYPGQDGDADAHQARIHLKRMRYCAELALDAAALPTGALIELLTEMQNHLGQWNDQITAARWLARIGRRRSALARRTAWSVRMLQSAAERARTADAQRERILREWPGLVRAVEPWLAKTSDGPATGSPAGRPDGPADSDRDGRNDHRAGLKAEPGQGVRVREDVEHV